jgi:hypothetical protein
MVTGRLVSVGIGPEEVVPEQYQVDDACSFAVQCFFRAGVSSALGTQDQTLLVCSPAWLLERQPAHSVIRGQGLLLMQRYDGKTLRQSLARFVERCASDNAKDVFDKIARLGFSEFEDYDKNDIPKYFIDEQHESKSFGPSRV